MPGDAWGPPRHVWAPLDHAWSRLMQPGGGGHAWRCLKTTWACLGPSRHAWSRLNESCYLGVPGGMPGGTWVISTTQACPGFARPRNPNSCNLGEPQSTPADARGPLEHDRASLDRARSRLMQSGGWGLLGASLASLDDAWSIDATYHECLSSRQNEGLTPPHLCPPL